MSAKKQNIFVRMEEACLLWLDYTAARITSFFYDLTAEARERKSTAYGAPRD